MPIHWFGVERHANDRPNDRLCARVGSAWAHKFGACLCLYRGKGRFPACVVFDYVPGGIGFNDKSDLNEYLSEFQNVSRDPSKLSLSHTVCLALPPAPAVKISQGQLTGLFQTSLAGKRFMAFYGIPYGKPPVGDLRFKVRRAPMVGRVSSARAPNSKMLFFAGPAARRAVGGGARRRQRGRHVPAADAARGNTLKARTKPTLSNSILSFHVFPRF